MQISKKLMLLMVLLAPGLALAQGVRYDVPPILGPTGLPLPNIAVTLCSGIGSISGATCSPQIQSYTDITLGIQCALGNPVTLTASTACQSTSDTFGNAGFWLSPGAYIFCLTGRGIAGSCYNLTVPAGSTPSGTLRSGTIQLGDGSAAAPSYSFTTQTGTGFFHPGGGSTGVSVSGVQRFNFGFNLQQDGTVGSYCFTNGNPFSVACDVGISRPAAGAMAAGNGTPGDRTGIFEAGRFDLGAGNNGIWGFRPGFLDQISTGGFAWSSGSNATAGIDTGLSRSSAGTVAIGNGTQGDASGTLSLSNVKQGIATTNFQILDNLGVAHFFISGTSPFANTFIQGNGSGGVFIGGGSLVGVPDGSAIIFFRNPADTGISAIGAKTLAIGSNVPGDFSGTLKTTTVNAVSGFQVNGTSLAASNLSNGVTGSGLVVLGTFPTLNSMGLSEGAAPSGAPNLDVLYGDSTAHRVKMNNNNVGTDVVVGAVTTDTLTNKRVTPRVVSLADGTSFTLSSDTADMNTHVNTQIAGTLTANAPTGTPTDGQKLMLRIKSTNVQTYAWNAIFRGSTTSPLPTATSGGSKTDYIGFIFNAADTKWDCIAVDMGH